MFAVLAAAALLLAQAAPAGGAPASSGEAAAKPARPEKPKMVCTTEVPTGSKFPRRVCMTPEEAKAMEDAARERSDAMRACRQGMGC